MSLRPWLLAPLLAALSINGAPGQQAPTPPDTASASEARVLLRGNHERLAFAQDVQRVAVGDPARLSFEVLNNREVLVLGLATGRTTLIVWLADGTLREFAFSVESDLTLLQAALASVHPGITAAMAPDRDAIVLRGLVPDVTYSRAAELVATRYLDAARAGSGSAETLVTGEPGVAPVVANGDATRPQVVPPPSGRVINLIRLEKLPPRTEERIHEAIASLGGERVTVRRILRGPVPDDAIDVFVLEGKVRTQVSLVRILDVATHTVVGETDSRDDVRVFADEAGSLTASSAATARGAGSVGGASSQTFGSVGGNTLFAGSGSQSGATRLDNRIDFNVGRAKALEAAKGRVLSFIEVTDLPQVRVDIRIYEINRTDLSSLGSDFTAIASDFNQPPLSPAAGAVAVQGAGAATVGGAGATDLQNVLGFLSGGFSNEFQLSVSHLAIDSVLRYLESRGIARSLSGPSLTVLSGELALFQVGGEVPVPVAFSPAFGGGSTGGTTTPGVFSGVEFQSFGVQLGVRPLVGEDDVITLDVVPQVVSPDEKLTLSLRTTTGTNPPTTAFESRSLRTSARLDDGQALVIGGLDDHHSDDSSNSTPFLSQIPLVGWLFKSFSVANDDLELVIVVNPVIVRSPLPNTTLWAFPEVNDVLERCVRRKRGGDAKSDATAPAVAQRSP